jgi:protein subunit release factor B
MLQAVLWQRSFASIKKQIAEMMKKRVAVSLNESDLKETFMRGSGPGGQAVNKASNAVRLVHVSTGVQVKVGGVF